MLTPGLRLDDVVNAGVTFRRVSVPDGDHVARGRPDVSTGSIVDIFYATIPK